MRLLGGLELRCGDLVVTRLASRSVTALLARLAMRPRQRHSREQLTELLWPGASPDVGRNRFRNALAMLRRVLEPPGWAAGSVLSADRLTVQWHPHALVCDVVDFERLALARQPAAARRRYGGELLPGFYDEWIVEERDRLQAMVEALDAAGQDEAVAVDAPSPVAPRAVAGPSTGLPTGVGSFFGRGAELVELERTLDGHRLVTLTGVGGAGKTRLAIEVARRREAAGRVAFVALAECEAAPEIVERVRAALHLPDNGAKDAAKVLDQIAAELDNADPLLVLDNYEQLVEDGGVPVVETLLARLPRLRLLVTSRRALRLPAECEFALAPLALPEADASLEDGLRNAGVALFVERARDVRRDFQLGARNVAEVVRICRVLEGLPLAIELAAAKVRAWPLADMARALEAGRTEVLQRTTPGRAAHRHASLHAAIAWSWRLLSASQQAFAVALTVFRGGWTAEAAQAVSRLERPHELLESLVVDSLVQSRPDADGGLHFSMLETVREFAREQLAPAQAAALRQRHRDWFLALVRDARSGEALVDEVTHANALAAIASALEDGVPAQAVQLSLALFRQWLSLGTSPQVRELLRRMADGLADDTNATDDTDGVVAFLCALSRLLMQAGEVAPAQRLAERAKALALASGEAGVLAEALFTDARVRWTLTRDQAIAADLAVAMDKAREAGVQSVLALGEAFFGTIALARDDLVAADAHFARSVEHHLAVGDRRGALISRQGRLRCLVMSRRFDRAIDVGLAGVREARELRHVEAELLYLDQLGMAYANVRRDTEALDTYRDQTALARRQHKVYLISYGLWNQALLLARLRQPALAATVMAFAQRYWEHHFTPLQPDEQRHVRKVTRLVAAQIGEAAGRVHWERGMTVAMSEGLDLGCRGEAG